ncbi:hypothetical protein ACFOZ7_07155 [Natribaculum luteum]|uniref:Uncharacterized protein n=1 Tax=Natribaculum luteum TaxID=1586232 RepID=A0ABD5NXJ6_9EURY|nr:hypothetical protein [Natribaculum luteum]
MTNTQITDEAQRQLVRNLGMSQVPEEGRLTLERIRESVDAETDPEFASMGVSIRRDLSGKLDESLLEEELGKLATQIERLPDVREAGIPDGETEPEQLYRELVAPGWRVYDHLVDVGFFESVEDSLPRFTPEHIEHTAHELIRTEPLTSELSTIGFDEREKLVLVMNVVNNNTRLARWVPTKEIPEEVEFDVEHVPPLHQRAMGGALLWINALDVHLWQNRILVTDEILDDGYSDVKAMLGGLYAMTKAALDVAEDGPLTDAQLTAALTASAAITIVNQEEICKDVFWITEDMRAPSKARPR